jgi:hypothetical protein
MKKTEIQRLHGYEVKGIFKTGKCLIKIEHALKIIMAVSDISVASPLVQHVADQLMYFL